MNINVFLLFLSFVFFKLRERERERERERGYIKLLYKEKQSQGYLSYFLWWSSCGESFLFYGLIDFMLFLTLAWRKWLLQSEIFLCLLLPGVLALAPSATSPVQQLTFLIFYFRWREGVPTSVLGSQPIVWLLPSSFRCQATRVRLPSTNICWSPRDPHSFLTVILWRLATVNSNTGNSINLISIVSVGDHVTIPKTQKMVLDSTLLNS